MLNRVISPVNYSSHIVNACEFGSLKHFSTLKGVRKLFRASRGRPTFSKELLQQEKNGHWLVLLLFQRQRHKIYDWGNWKDLNSHCIKPIGQNSLTKRTLEGDVSFKILDFGPCFDSFYVVQESRS